MMLCMNHKHVFHAKVIRWKQTKKLTKQNQIQHIGIIFFQCIKPENIFRGKYLYMTGHETRYYILCNSAKSLTCIFCIVGNTNTN